MREDISTATSHDVPQAADTEHAGLRGALDDAAAIPGIDTTALAALRDKLAQHAFNLVVAGEFKRGKSSVVNALLGADVLPTGVVPLTSVVTVLRYGTSPSAVVAFEDGKRQSIGMNTLPDYVTERGNPRNGKHVKVVEAAFPASWLQGGIRLIDTPGIASTYDHNTDVTYGFLPQADAVIFVASVDQPVSRPELRFLADIRAYADRVFCLLNKIDHLSASELAESVAFSSATLREAVGTQVPVFPVSARLAIAAQNPPDDAYARSGFAAFNTALRQFLQQDSGEVLAHSVQRHLSRLLSACRLGAELELRTLAAPLATLTENLHAFAAKKTELLQQRGDFAALLEADTQALVKQTIEPAIMDFKTTLARRLAVEVPAWVEAANDQHAIAPQKALEQHIVDEVRRAFDAFRVREDSAASLEYDRICERFHARLQESVDALMRYSAELFAIRFEPVATEPLHAARSRFYYQFWEEPTGSTLLARAVTGWLPGSLRRPLMLRHGRRRVAELVEMQAGRLRYDFEQRITRAMRDTRAQLLRRMDATIGAIESALAGGRAAKEGGESAAAARRHEIAAIIRQIDRVATRAETTA